MSDQAKQLSRKPTFWAHMVSGGYSCPWCSRIMSSYDPCCKTGDAYLRGRFEQLHDISPSVATGRGGAQQS